MKPKQSQLTQEMVMKLFHYNEGTGIFTHILPRSGITVGNVAGGKNRNGYIRISVYGSLIYAHRLAWLYITGEWPEDQIDHINHVRDDNSFNNLREVNNSTNHRNIKMPGRNKSGIVGVYWDKGNNKWAASIKVHNVSLHLGYFDDIVDASHARQNAEKKYGFHENHGRLQGARG